MGVKIRVQNTQLKEDHLLPFYLSAFCPSCYPYLKNLQKRGAIPADRSLCTVFVSENSDFAYKCINSRCEENRNFYTLSCMLKHRDFQTVSMDVDLQDQLWLDEDGNPELDNPEMESFISLHYGPMKNCPGHLEWSHEKDINTGADTLVCSHCTALYSCHIFSMYDRMSRKLTQRHNDYELWPTKDGGKESPWKIRLKRFSDYYADDMIVGKPVPEDWCLVVEELSFKGTNFSFWRNMR